jgi:hypothetical protein
MPPAPPKQRSPNRSAADKRGDAAPALDTWLSFDDLRRAGIVSSRKTLREWQRDPRIRFPLGRLLAPSTRRWSKQREIDPWLASRPVERDAFDDAEHAAAEAQP